MPRLVPMTASVLAVLQPATYLPSASQNTSRSSISAPSSRNNASSLCSRNRKTKMQAAVDRVQPDIAGTVAALSMLARFAVNNPDYVRAAVDVLSIATQEAETFFELTGPQKQAYVQAMIMALLEQNGFVEPSGLWREIVKGAVNLAIDATVAVFNRRQLFTPRRRALAAPGVR